MNAQLYVDTTPNPFARTIRLDERSLRIGFERVPLAELNMLAMAEAYQRGRWLGGGGTERPFDQFRMTRGIVPVTRISGACRPLRARRPAELARTLGELATRWCRGPRTVEREAEHAHAVGVPLWLARRAAPGPHGPVTVTVDRRSVRADVWAGDAPPVRLRAPGGVTLSREHPTRGLEVTIGGERAQLTVESDGEFARNTVTLRLAGQSWLLRARSELGSELLRNGQPVATITRPRRTVGERPLLPLAEVTYGSAEPLDTVVTHALAVSFGLGDSAGMVRFNTAHQHPPSRDAWREPWFTGVGNCPGDSGLGASGDEWGGLFDSGFSGGGDGGRA